MAAIRLLIALAVLMMAVGAGQRAMAQDAAADQSQAQSEEAAERDNAADQGGEGGDEAARQVQQPPIGQGDRELRATIVGVKGNCQYRENEQADWQPAKEGVIVTQGAAFRTGLGASIDIVIEPDHEMTIKRFGMVTLVQAVEENGVVKTNVGLKYGRTEYRVEEGGAEHESTIAAPGMTLAIRSTDTEVGFDPLYGGRVAVYDSPNSIVRNLGGPTVVMTNGRVDEGDLSPAQHQLRRRALLMLHRYATSTEDQEIIERLPGFGDIEKDTDVRFRSTVIEQQRDALIAQEFAAESFSAVVFDPNLTFRVFELGSPDGDTVNVLFNGQLLQSNLVITENGTPFNFFLSQRNNELTLEAVDFGTSGGISAAVELPDGGATFDFAFEQGGDTSQTLDVIFEGASTAQ